jgi:ABC-type dipeptide/oligopeptide/nickel transport system permease subunit
LIPGTAICLTILAVYTLAEWLGRVIALPGLTRPPTL